MRILSKRDVARCDFQLRMMQIELQNCIRVMKGRYGSAEATSNSEDDDDFSNGADRA